MRSRWMAGTMTALWTALLASCGGELVDDITDDTSRQAASVFSKKKKKKKVDLILVVDESGSMMDDRQAVADAMPAMLKMAKKKRLDVRVGVTSVVSPSGPYAALAGKFCSRASSDPHDSGGVDRFLRAKELATIKACIMNPPGYESAFEYTQLGAEEAVQRHLPRKAHSPFRIRKNAELVVVYITDEVSEELKPLLPYQARRQCSLGAPLQAAVDQAVQPQIDLFSGTLDPEAEATVHLIGGTCSSSNCYADIGHGMIEIALATGGLVQDICQKDLRPAFRAILRSVLLPKRQMDLILVVDESGSMMDNRAALGTAVQNMLLLAKAAKVNVRVGVTGVVNPSGPHAATLGKFCSVASSDMMDSGGTDRFLKAKELATIKACINNPPGYEYALEHTQLGATSAVKGHLPRKANDPARIRPGAQLVVVYVTDEVSEELKPLLPYQARTQCSLGAALQAAVDQAVQPQIDLFRGKTHLGAKAAVHLVGGTCGSTCAADVGHGMNEVASATGGRVIDVCQQSLTQDFVQILTDAMKKMP